MARATSQFQSWSGTPNMTGAVGTQKSFNLGAFIKNPGHRTLYYSVTPGYTLPSGWTKPLNTVTVNWSGTGTPGNTIVRFRATDANDGYFVDSPDATITITGAVVLTPSMPTNVVVQTVSSTSLSVTWQAGAGGSTIVTYVIYRSPDNTTGSFVQVGTDPAPPSAFVDTGLTANTPYWYKVEAVDGNGAISARSVSGMGTTASAGGPAQPQNVSVAVVSDTTLRVSWIPGSGGTPATSFNIFRSATSGSGFSQINSPVAASDSFTGTVNTALPSYNAAWATPSGAQSCEIGVGNTFRGSGLGASVNYRNLSFAAAHYSKVKIASVVQSTFASCGAAVRVQSGANSYYWAQYGKPNVYVGQTVAGTRTDWETVAGFVDGDTIELAIDPAVLTTVYLKRNGTTVKTYTGKSALSGGRPGVVAFNGQGVEGEGSAGTWAGGETNWAGPYDDTTLSAGQTRYYKVQAVDANSAVSAQSAEQSNTTSGAPVPAMPTGVVATGTSSSTISVSWTPGSGGSVVTEYRIYRSAVSGGTFTLLDTDTASPYVDSGLQPGATWYYKVAAYDGVVEGNKSTQAAGTTIGATYSLNVSWTPATQNDDGSPIGTILNHKVKYSQTSGGPYQAVTVTWPATTKVLSLPSGGTWYVVVTTVTNLGESVASAESSRVANVS